MMIAWKVLEDGELLCEGSFTAALLYTGSGDGVTMRGVQLVPLVRVKVRDLLQQRATVDNSDAPSFIEFPIDRDALAIERPEQCLQRAGGGAGAETRREWTCRLELIQKLPLSALEARDKSWFDTKIDRAVDLRARGNNCFKSDKFKAAIRYYKKVRTCLCHYASSLSYLLTRIYIKIIGPTMARVSSGLRLRH